MEIQLWWTGKTSYTYLEEGIKDYRSRIEKMCKFSIIQFKGTKNISDPIQIRIQEEKELEKKLNIGDYIILLDENGKKFSSKSFANQIIQWQNASIKRLIFIIGGAFGFSDKLKQKAQLLLSFSDFTLSHQLIRLFFMEQIYRSISIIHKLPYHND